MKQASLPLKKEKSLFSDMIQGCLSRARMTGLKDEVRILLVPDLHLSLQSALSLFNQTLSWDTKSPSEKLCSNSRRSQSNLKKNIRPSMGML